MNSLVLVLNYYNVLRTYLVNLVIVWELVIAYFFSRLFIGIHCLITLNSLP